MTRAIVTVVGAAVALFLIYLGTQFDLDDGSAEYWTAIGLFAAAGLTMALSQLLGGWTKWGWPRVSGSVFLVGFLPVLVLGGWILLSAQPADFFNTSNWSGGLGARGLVDDLAEVVGAIAFLIGLTFGFTFDTTGPRVARDMRARDSAPTVGTRDSDAVQEPAPEPAPRSGPPPSESA